MIDLIFLLIVILLGLPVVTFMIECVLGLFSVKPASQDTDLSELSCAILMPAHNETDVIGETLKRLQTSLSEHDQVIVVADNCNDDTAEIASSLGAHVLERQHDTDRGKGFALDHGLQYLKDLESPPDIVIILDADCLVAPDAINALKRAIVRTNKPAQAQYLMLRGEIQRISIKVSEFAFLVKNKVRLRGLAKLGLPVPLTGTGMAFPWDAIVEAHLATGDIVEDMRLGVELVEQGRGAQYCDDAFVYSYFPTSEQAERTQRERWEHGHLNTIKRYVPRLLSRAVNAKRADALAMALDLMIPPLSLLVLMIVGLTAFFGLWNLFIETTFFFNTSIYYLTLLLISVSASWLVHGRHILSLQELIHIPIYIISKIVIYVGYLIRKQTKWIRTDRN